MGEESKIDVLNRSIASMIRTFAAEDSVRGEIQVAVITFGGETAQVHHPLVPARQAAWRDMRAFGRTPMGHAFDLARELLEDPASVPERAFRPTIILVSDGMPTPPDSWREPLARLLESDRAGKALRLAVGIGSDRTPDAEEVLVSFSSEGVTVMQANQVDKIGKFFDWLTVTVTTQLRTARPVPSLADLDRL